jgi:hypothetical protein
VKGQITLKTLLLVLALVLLPVSASAQALIDLACNPPAQPMTVTSGAPFAVMWVMDPLVPASQTDPTLVPQRVNGYYLQIDGGPKQEITAVPVGTGDPCPAGTSMAGKVPYQFRTTTGVPKGNHSVTITAWNFALDAFGNPTTTRREGPAVSVPFVGVELVHTGPPQGPQNVIIRK